MTDKPYITLRRVNHCVNDLALLRPLLRPAPRARLAWETWRRGDPMTTEKMSLKLMNNAVTRRSVTAKAFRTQDTVSYLKTLPGISAPFPNVFDPAGLVDDTVPIIEVRRWRESELVHCRVAMLAAVGFLVGEQVEDIPAFINFEGDITGPAINQFQQIRQGFWEPLLIAIGLAETYRVSVGWSAPLGEDLNTLKDDYDMGNLYFDPLGFAPKDPAELNEMKTKELNNGRLAMIAVAGFTVQELTDQKGIFEHMAL
eukprot:gene3767-13830_t